MGREVWHGTDANSVEGVGLLGLLPGRPRELHGGRRTEVYLSQSLPGRQQLGELAPSVGGKRVEVHIGCNGGDLLRAGVRLWLTPSGAFVSQDTLPPTAVRIVERREGRVSTASCGTRSNAYSRRKPARSQGESQGWDRLKGPPGRQGHGRRPAPNRNPATRRTRSTGTAKRHPDAPHEWAPQARTGGGVEDSPPAAPAADGLTG